MSLRLIIARICRGKDNFLLDFGLFYSYVSDLVLYFAKFRLH